LEKQSKIQNGMNRQLSKIVIVVMIATSLVLPNFTLTSDICSANIADVILQMGAIFFLCLGLSLGFVALTFKLLIRLVFSKKTKNG
jgi:hypothetical protein